MASERRTSLSGCRQCQCRVEERVCRYYVYYLFYIVLISNYAKSVIFYVRKKIISRIFVCCLYSDDIVRVDDRVQVAGNNSLLIFSLAPVDSGIYTCRVENEFGFDEIHIRLNVQGKAIVVHVMCL